MLSSHSSKIYWYGFKRQLKELFYLLLFENYITCEWDEFLSHFTGKKFDQNQKFRINKKYNRKLIWNKEGYLLILITNHLLQKGFLISDTLDFLKSHFQNIPVSALKQYEKNKNKPATKKLQSKLDCLFPAPSGYRCKERLYYRSRNLEPQNKVLKKCGLDI
jgi:hypothetical protein